MALPATRLFWQRLKREPLVRFLALGTLIFVVAHRVDRERTLSERRIVVDAQVEQRLTDLSETQNGVRPSSGQLKQLVENYIEEEMMYREALRMGLDRDDEIIRRRLIQKVEFLQRDVAAGSAPAESELRAYYGTHPELFRTAASVAFEQYFFSPDRDGAAAQTRAQRARDEITTHGEPGNGVATKGAPAHGAAQLSDPFPLLLATAGISRNDAISLFGATPIVEALFTAPDGEWSAPVRSGYGWHLIKVTGRRAPDRLPFEAVREQVQAAYLDDRMKAAGQRQLETLRARYQLVRSTKASARTS